MIVEYVFVGMDKRAREMGMPAFITVPKMYLSATGLNR